MKRRFPGLVAIAAGLMVVSAAQASPPEPYPASICLTPSPVFGAEWYQCTPTLIPAWAIATDISINMIIESTLFSGCEHRARKSATSDLHRMRVRRWGDTKRYSGVDPLGVLGDIVTGPQATRSVHCHSDDAARPGPTGLSIEYRRQIIADNNTNGP
jgi:hypothetical protein